AFFYRRTACNGGYGRFWGGVSGEGDGLIGADAWLPLSSKCGLLTAFNYRIPQSDDDNGVNNNRFNDDSSRESFGISISLVWYPGFCRSGGCCNQYRPLFNVADNTTFMPQLHGAPNNI